MSVVWHDEAQQQLFDWMKIDRKTALKIYRLILDIQRNGALEGIGKPERLRYVSSYSRRIDDQNRLIYDINEQGMLEILSCKGHYDDK